MDSVSHENRKILVVEDDAMVRKYVAVLLDSEGYQVVEAEDGDEMFSALAEHDFDLIVLDIMLPDGNGVDFARKLRATNATVPIVFATGVTDMDTRRHAAGLMQIDYITKPFQAEQLLGAIQAMFDGSPVMRPPVDETLPPPVIEDVSSWYAAPLVWGPALVFAVIVIGALLVIPKDEGPAMPRVTTSHAENEQTTAVQDANAAASGIVLKDAEVPAGRVGQAAGGAATGGTPSASLNLEDKIAQACGALPVHEIWSNNSIKRIMRNVTFVHKGNWRAYLEFWESRLRTTQDLNATEGSIRIGSTTINGADVEKYTDLLDARVRYIKCAQKIVQTSK